MKKNSKKLLLAGVACALGLSFVVSTHAVYEKELLDAAGKGDLAAVKRYIAEGANVNSEVNYTKALTEAAFGGHLDVVKWLVEHGADVNQKNACGETSLFAAVRTGNKNIVKYLVEHGADIHAKNSFGSTILLSAIPQDDEYPNDNDTALIWSANFEIPCVAHSLL